MHFESNAHGFQFYVVLGGLMWIIIPAAAVVVFFDARRLGLRKGLRPGLGDMGPVGWFFSVLLLSIIALPYYAAIRGKLADAALKATTPRPVYGNGATVLVLVCAIGPVGYHVQEIRDGSIDAATRATRACDVGQLDQCEALGEAYELGDEVPVDLAKSTASFARACDGKLMMACYNLGRHFEHGMGTASDLSRAAELYTTSCDARIGGACTNLGVMALEAEGMPRDLPRARALFERGCTADEPQACANLANLYAKGVGGVQDGAKAQALRQRACAGRVQAACP